MVTKKISADEARELQTQLRLKQYRDREENGFPPMVPPTFVDAFIQPGNLATKDILVNGFDLVVPPWPRVSVDDDVHLFINNTLVFKDPIYTVPNPLPNPLPPITYKVEPFYLGVYKGGIKIQYRVESGSGQTDVSELLEIQIDREPPGTGASPAALQFPAAMNNKVTLQYLDANQNQVIATVPTYAPMEAGQTVTLWWNGKRTAAIAPVTVTALDVANGTVSIIIPGAQFRGVTDESVLLQYSLSNRAGFEGFPSETSTLAISLQPQPNNLRAPTVPLAADGLIDLADADKGVEIQVDAYTNVINGDQIVAYWGNTALNPEAVLANNFPVFVSVPRSVVLAEGSGDITVH